MIKLKSLSFARVASAAFFLVCSPAMAQWQVPDNAVPVGRGSPNQGFKNVPLPSGTLLIGQSGIPQAVVPSGDVTINTLGVTAIGTAKVTAAMIAAMTSAQLAGILTDETGSGLAVFGTAPSISSPVLSGTVAGTYTLGGTPSISGGAVNSGVVGAAYGGTGVANAYNITVANPFTTIGAAPLSLTVTGTTNSTLPAGTHTLSALDVVETWTGAKTFASGKLLLGGSTSGAGTLNAPAVAASYVWTLPALTGTLLTADLTKTLTNTTFDTAGAGNSFSINGVSANANTGTGAVVRSASPNITTPTGIVKGDVGLGNVDNTSDATKWAATKTLTNTTYDTSGTGNSFSINGVAATANTGTGAVVRAASPTLSGTPAAPTASNGTNTTQIATTAFVQSAVAASTAGVASFNGLTGIVASNIVVQKFTSSGTYTPTPGMRHAVVECQGGGGGGGAAIFTSGNFTFGSGGGGGTYSRVLLTASAVGASQTVIVGAGGTGGSGNGGSGGASSFGSLCTAPGGNGGPLAQAAVSVSTGATGSSPGTGDISVPGGAGATGIGGSPSTVTVFAGAVSGSSVLGGSVTTALNNAGTNGAGYGGGGAGGIDLNITTRNGGAGAPGVVIITEYINL